MSGDEFRVITDCVDPLGLGSCAVGVAALLGPMSKLLCRTGGGELLGVSEELGVRTTDRDFRILFTRDDCVGGGSYKDREEEPVVICEAMVVVKSDVVQV